MYIFVEEKALGKLEKWIFETGRSFPSCVQLVDSIRAIVIYADVYRAGN